MLVTDVRREPATAALIERAEIDDNIRALVLTGFGAREMRSNRSDLDVYGVAGARRRRVGC